MPPFDTQLLPFHWRTVRASVPSLRKTQVLPSRSVGCHQTVAQPACSRPSARTCSVPRRTGAPARTRVPHAKGRRRDAEAVRAKRGVDSKVHVPVVSAVVVDLVQQIPLSLGVLAVDAHPPVTVVGAGVRAPGGYDRPVSVHPDRSRSVDALRFACPLDQLRPSGGRVVLVHARASPPIVVGHVTQYHARAVRADRVPCPASPDVARSSPSPSCRHSAPSTRERPRGRSCPRRWRNAPGRDGCR